LRGARLVWQIFLSCLWARISVRISAGIYGGGELGGSPTVGEARSRLKVLLPVYGEDHGL